MAGAVALLGDCSEASWVNENADPIILGILNLMKHIQARAKICNPIPETEKGKIPVHLDGDADTIWMISNLFS